MKAIVAGGAGFIGSNLIHKLLRQKWEVVCIDDFSNGRREYIENYHKINGFSLYEGDISDLSFLEQVFQTEIKKGMLNCIFHMAANSDIQASADNPGVEYKNTYTTTFHLLECMRKFDIKKIFFCSTSAVYGEKEKQLLSENTPDLRPISYYGACKLGCEGLLSAYTYMNDFSTLIFRFPNVVGPGLTHGVIYDFIRKLRANPKELEILGNGYQSKPYMYVEDLVDAIYDYTISAKKGMEIYNIGVMTHTTVNKIADIVCEEMGLHNVEYKYTGGNVGWKGDVSEFSYDLSKIHATGWKEQMTSDEAIRKTVKYINTKYSF